ncbi:6-phosphofructokinase [Zavarzinella formosa]|uniref:6-phosphofructokinase n=1 Tax=Zavarzinella formosa TaxID=360055 RepID=UPI0004965A6D|nr:6-phosphofructokinase [Zavarzinella formosa]
MKRIAILTAGGDTPALNATLAGAVTRANQRKIEVFGIIKGFSGLLNPRVPHVHLNPLFTTIPELVPTLGGTLLGASRDYVDSDDKTTINAVISRLGQLKVDGLICVGGDGTLNGMQALGESLPTVLAPKTIDNDLGLNYQNEADEWERAERPGKEPVYSRRFACETFELDQMMNYVTPGYATSVFVSASGVERIRTTAESHRRIAIVEVMGRHSGYIALGACYGRPDLLLVPECPLNVDLLVEKIKQIYELQKNVVIVCGEGIVDQSGQELGAELNSTDPAGNKILSGASEALRSLLVTRLGDDYFTSKRRNESASAAIFTRKIGHTQRGGRPIMFDRFYAMQLGGNAVDMLAEGQINSVSILQWSEKNGFHVAGIPANDFRDRWGLIHARQMHPSFYDPIRMKPSATGIDYLKPIFNNAVGPDDCEALQKTFSASNLSSPYHSVNTDINKRIRTL